MLQAPVRIQYQQKDDKEPKTKSKKMKRKETLIQLWNYGKKNYGKSYLVRRIWKSFQKSVKDVIQKRNNLISNAGKDYKKIKLKGPSIYKSNILAIKESN